MNLIDSCYMAGDKKLMYSILDNGFDIYIEGMNYPAYHQPEPFIPDSSLSYEENAKKMCERLHCVDVKPVKPIEDRLTDIEANVDYLMLLNDPESAAE